MKIKIQRFTYIIRYKSIIINYTKALLIIIKSMIKCKLQLIIINGDFAMLKWLQDNARSAREKLAAEVSKFKNKDFMEAVVAGCALVASADGEISSAEKQKLIGFIQNSDELKAFDLDQVIGSFNNICSKMEFDQQIGRAEALKKIGLIRSNVEASRLMVRVCCAIGASDGQFDANERAVVRTIAQELGLNPADFDL